MTHSFDSLDLITLIPFQTRVIKRHSQKYNNVKSFTKSDKKKYSQRQYNQRHKEYFYVKTKK